MSKYDPLWKYIQENGGDTLKLTFDQIQDILGIPIDHSFLSEVQKGTCGIRV